MDLGSLVGAMGAGNMMTGGVNIANMAMQERTNRMQRDMARDNLNWQKDQMRYRYQWTVEDMRKAGLNPILAATKGISPGAAGGGGNISPTAPKFELSDLAIKSQIEQTRANTAKTMAETRVIEGAGPKADVSGRIWEGINKLYDSLESWSAKSKRDIQNRVGYFLGDKYETGNKVMGGKIKKRGHKNLDTEEKPVLKFNKTLRVPKR